MQSDPANLKKLGAKRIDGTLKLRIRRKMGGSSTEQWNYRFSTALMLDRKPTKSDLDLDDYGSDVKQLLEKRGRGKKKLCAEFSVIPFTVKIIDYFSIQYS